MDKNIYKYMISNKNLKNKIILFVFCVYILCIILLTILPPRHFQPDNFRIDWSSIKSIINSSVNLIPFATISRYLRIISWNVAINNLIGNVLLFLPFGILLPSIWEKMRKWSIIAITTLLISVTIEVMQLFLGRRTDIDDVILNVSGAMLGYIMYSMSVKILLPVIRRRQ